ncbi:hypothetical protein EC912_10516 [Luteibacter rhizovicinus]|uniref:Uncharacterized protein n=1 Tax=Luteibacter rhizovicinus TaxID=242606 RepID=A0A4R3YLK1_9GAMM|nr:hypothetical protein EC912_10516 [Luteibacter rhizovicinus]
MHCYIHQDTAAIGLCKSIAWVIVGLGAVMLLKPTKHRKS